MSSIKGTPAYLKKILHQVLAMVKQLGTPTFFLTLSCSELRWNELISIIFKLNVIDIADEDIDRLSYHERCDTLNKNPILVVRHFQYRAEMFFKVIVLDGPLGKTRYYAFRVEFRVRGTPHMHSFIWILTAPKLTKFSIDECTKWFDSIVRSDLHSFIWILNAPKLTTFSIDECTKWVDGIVRSDLLDSVNEQILFELAKIYQTHHHSKTCRKYRNEKCRFHFGKFFIIRTIIAQP